MEQNQTLEQLVEKHQHDIPEWKEKHGKIKSLTLTAVGGSKIPYIIGKPTIETMDMWTRYNNDNKVSESNKALIENCVLAGDKDLLYKDIDIRNAMLRSITNQLEVLAVEEKEL